MKTYYGDRNGRVTVHCEALVQHAPPLSACSAEDERHGARQYPLPPRLDLAYFSVAFGWGYVGIEPLQLALAILADCLGEEIATAAHQDFCREVVANLDPEWELSDDDVATWYREWHGVLDDVAQSAEAGVCNG